jgi:hypothetical protein
MLRNIHSAQAKHIRRRLEDITANGQYLATSHDTRERELLLSERRRLVNIGESLRRAVSEIDLLLEIDTDENARHIELWRAGQLCNREVAECEETNAAEPPERTAALAIG